MSEFAQPPAPEGAAQGPAQDVHQAGPHGEPEAEHAPDPEPGGGPGDEGGPTPVGVGVRPTGHGPVDAELRRLEDADHLAVSGHLEVYEDVHRGLRETLAALDRPHTPRS